ncbi:hypothetical protein [Propionibacterium sp.]|uniref:hypothetical protein n=1 Tax=Propionibacterium sp. TaxID=1977903 RepID=UPI0039EB13FF
MVLALALEPEQPAQDGDVFGRSMLGWPRDGGLLSAAAEVGLRGRGPWHLDAEKLFAEDFAFVIQKGTGLIGSVIMITGVARFLNCRRLVEGPIIVDHPAIGEVLSDLPGGPAPAGLAPDDLTPPELVQLLKTFWTLGGVVPTTPTVTVADITKAVDDIQAELAALAAGA